MHPICSSHNIQSVKTSTFWRLIVESIYLGPWFFVFLFFWFFLLFRVELKAHGSSQARGQIGAAAASLHHSHSNMGSEAPLQPIPELMEMLAPQPTEQGQGSNPYPHVYKLDSFLLRHYRKSIPWPMLMKKSL